MRIYRARTHHDSTYLIALTVPLRLSVLSSMDYVILLFSLYVACLFGISVLLLLVARKHDSPERLANANFGETPAWRFRAQETSSLLTWVRRDTRG